MARGVGSWKRGRPAPPPGVGPRAARVRIRFGEWGTRTTCADLAREMGLDRNRVWSWEARGHFPGREKLAEFYGRLKRVRDERVDSLKLAAWVELGPDNVPPFDEPPSRAIEERMQPVDEAVAPQDARAVARLVEQVAVRWRDDKKSEAAMKLIDQILQLARDAKIPFVLPLACALGLLAGGHHAEARELPAPSPSASCHTWDIRRRRALKAALRLGCRLVHSLGISRRKIDLKALTLEVEMALTEITQKPQAANQAA